MENALRETAGVITVASLAKLALIINVCGNVAQVQKFSYAVTAEIARLVITAALSQQLAGTA